MGKDDKPGDQSGGGSSQPATQTQRPTQVPGSQGPATPDTHKQAETVQHPKK